MYILIRNNLIVFQCKINMNELKMSVLINMLWLEKTNNFETIIIFIIADMTYLNLSFKNKLCDSSTFSYFWHWKIFVYDQFYSDQSYSIELFNVIK